MHGGRVRAVLKRETLCWYRNTRLVKVLNGGFVVVGERKSLRGMDIGSEKTYARLE
jgi:hypothetical protein